MDGASILLIFCSLIIRTVFVLCHQFPLSHAAAAAAASTTTAAAAAAAVAAVVATIAAQNTKNVNKNVNKTKKIAIKKLKERKNEKHA